MSGVTSIEKYGVDYNENHAWSIVKLPNGKKVVGSRWLYKTKFSLDDTIDRHKDLLLEWTIKRPLLLLLK